MSDDNNVIQFPRDRQVRPLTEEDVNLSVQQIQMTAMERVVDEVGDMIFEAMCRSGFCIHDHDDNPTAIKDQALIYNSIRSAVFRKNGIFHPLQKMAEDMFDDLDLDDDLDEEVY